MHGETLKLEKTILWNTPRRTVRESPACLWVTMEGLCPKSVLPDVTIQNSGPRRNLASCWSRSLQKQRSFRKLAQLTPEDYYAVTEGNGVNNHWSVRYQLRRYITRQLTVGACIYTQHCSAMQWFSFYGGVGLECRRWDGSRGLVYLPW